MTEIKVGKFFSNIGRNFRTQKSHMLFTVSTNVFVIFSTNFYRFIVLIPLLCCRRRLCTFYLKVCVLLSGEADLGDGRVSFQLSGYFSDVKSQNGGDKICWNCRVLGRHRSCETDGLRTRFWGRLRPGRHSRRRRIADVVGLSPVPRQGPHFGCKRGSRQRRDEASLVSRYSNNGVYSKLEYSRSHRDPSHPSVSVTCTHSGNESVLNYRIYWGIFFCFKNGVRWVNESSVFATLRLWNISRMNSNISRKCFSGFRKKKVTLLDGTIQLSILIQQIVEFQKGTSKCSALRESQVVKMELINNGIEDYLWNTKSSHGFICRETYGWFRITEYLTFFSLLEKREVLWSQTRHYENKSRGGFHLIIEWIKSNEF